MDGNRRWAKEQGLPTLEGHTQGHVVFQDCVRWAKEVGIAHVVFYAFSTENWQRSESEVAYLLDLFSRMLTKLSTDVQEEKAQIRFIGHRSDFSQALQQLMQDVEQESAQYTGTTIWVALSYGGRVELVEAVNRAIVLGQPVTEESFAQLLWTAELPDPDMIIRTGGEQRLSNFLTWKSVYSELYFIEKHWPALTRDDFDDILVAYESRQRRRGK
jgi:undecaprenyl diphosphate synthase